MRKPTKKIIFIIIIATVVILAVFATLGTSLPNNFQKGEWNQQFEIIYQDGTSGIVNFGFDPLSFLYSGKEFVGIKYHLQVRLNNESSYDKIVFDFTDYTVTYSIGSYTHTNSFTGSPYKHVPTDGVWHDVLEDYIPLIDIIPSDLPTGSYVFSSSPSGAVLYNATSIFNQVTAIWSNAILPRSASVSFTVPEPPQPDPNEGLMHIYNLNYPSTVQANTPFIISYNVINLGAYDYVQGSIGIVGVGTQDSWQGDLQTNETLLRTYHSSGVPQTYSWTVGVAHWVDNLNRYVTDETIPFTITVVVTP